MERKRIGILESGRRVQSRGSRSDRPRAAAPGPPAFAQGHAALGLFTATVILIWHTTVLLAKRYRELSANLESGQEMELDPEDLALFDGSEKRKALVGVDGKLFDVTGRNLWRKGIHPGGHRAGTDLTNAFKEAPHGKEVFDRVTPVGRLLSKRSEGKRPSPRWAVLLGMAASSTIILVVVLWRW